MSNTAQRLSTALQHHQRGALQEADRLYREILAVEPQHADALHLLGVLANQVNRPQLAVQLISQAIAIRPSVTTYHNNLANALKLAGEPAKAEASYRLAITLDRTNADAQVNLGRLLEEQGRLKEAFRSYQEAVRCKPTMLEARLSLGNVAIAMGDTGVGVEACTIAVQQAPRNAAAHNALGNALLACDRRQDAEARYLRAVEIEPEFADAHYNLGNLYRSQERYATAKERYLLAIALSPEHAEAHNNLGVTYTDTGETEEAVAAFQRALALDPAYAEAHFNLGTALAKVTQHVEALRQFDAAIGSRPKYARAWHSRGTSQAALGELGAAGGSYRRALEQLPEDKDIASNLASVLALAGDPEGVAWLERLAAEQPQSAIAHWNYSMALLLHGDLDRGWREYEWRWQWERFPSPMRSFPQALWQGEALAGASILLHAEQGLGDTLQFARYAPLVAARGGRVILEVQPSLHRLLQHLPGVESCIRAGDPLPEFQLQCPLMSLPLAFGTTLATIPPIVPYLDGEDDRASHRSAAQPLRAGLVWAGNPKHQRDRLRSIPFALLRPLLEQSGVAFVSLQKDALAEAASLPNPVVAAEDFLDTARIVAELDLVITVDTAVAHLAGAMGKPVWILLSSSPDWRWGLETETTPWYRTARLFRQPLGEGWESTIARVTAELAGMIAARSRELP